MTIFSKEKHRPGNSLLRCIEPNRNGFALQVFLENSGTLTYCTKIITCDDESPVRLHRKAMRTLGEVYPVARLRAVDFKNLHSDPEPETGFP